MAKSDTAENGAPLPDYEKIWTAIGRLQASIEGIEGLQRTQADTIKRILANFGQFAATQKTQRKGIADLEKERATMAYEIRSIENDLNNEYGRMKPAIAAVEALAELLPDKRHRCRDAESCEDRR